MRLIRIILLGICAFALPFAASAEDKGFYVGAGGGANFQRDSDIDGSGASASADMKTGWTAAISGGYRYGNGWRTELELSHRRNNADKVNGVDTDGSANATAGMVNLLYGLKTGTKWTPYAGVGVGAARVKFSDVGTDATNSIDGSDVKFAYQGIAGFGYRVTEEAELFADYRYMGTLDVGANNRAGSDVEGTYSNHVLMAGLRFMFPTPKPAPTAMPAMMPEPKPEAKPEPKPEPAPQMAAKPEEPKPAPPPMARSYLVFFDWNKADLTAEAQKIVATAAANAKSGNVSRIQATGHADRSGPDAYNMRLSMRRAQSVKNELMRLGVPEKDIVLVAKGETEPLVQTNDGVREPQNRRVLIEFQ